MGQNRSPNTAAAEAKTLAIEYLFLDDEVCAPCSDTSDALERAVQILTGPMKEMGISIDIRRIHIASAELAIENEFVASPTIRVMGRDIDPAVTQDACPSCGDLAGGETKVDCRTWHWQGEVHNAAPVGKIVEEVMNEAVKLAAGSDGCCEDTCCGEPQTAPEFSLPENMQNFFAARHETVAAQN